MSWANVCAIPLFLIIIPATHHYLMPYIHDRLLVTGLGVSIAFCAYYVTKGIDKWLDQKRDNPEPFEVPVSMDDAYSDILDVLENRHVGPYFWRIRFKDEEQMQIQGILDFQEQHHILGHPPMMMPRQMMVNITFEEIEQPIKTEEEKQKEEAETLARGYAKSVNLTKVKLEWHVDSPGNRARCNEIIEDHTKEFKKACGLHIVETREEESIFMPPPWALIFLAGMVYFNFQQFEKVETQKAKALEVQQQREKQRADAEKERQRQIDEYERRRRQQEQEQQEQIRRYRGKYKTDPQQGSGNTYTPKIHDYNQPKINNPFSPVLTPQNTSPYQLKPKPDPKPQRQWQKPSTLDPYYKPPKSGN